MVKVHWEWKILATTAVGGSSSHRVARRGTSAIASPVEGSSSGDDNASLSMMTWSWTPSTGPSGAKAPPKVHDAAGNAYVFAFWHLRAGTTFGFPLGSSVLPNPGGFSVPVGEDGNAEATAYYVWDFGSGGGPNAVCIDAFDVEFGFIPDDF